MNEITQEKVKEWFEYKNGKLFWKINKIGHHLIGKRAGGIRLDGYIQIGVKGEDYLEHRLIWFYHFGYFPKQLDHINRIRDDNRIENLRESTQSQNVGNSRKPRTMNGKRCSSKYKGVSWDKQHKKWASYIMIKRKKIHLGLFNSEKKAANIYDEKAIELFGEFAKLNFSGFIP